MAATLLGEILRADGVVSNILLSEALQIQKEEGIAIVLVTGLIDEATNLQLASVFDRNIEMFRIEDFF